MDQNSGSSRDKAPQLLRQTGFWAVLLGGLALVLVFVQIAGVFSQPAPSAGSQVGEIAGEIKRSAWRSFFGLSKPQPEVKAFEIRDYYTLVAPILGVVAIVLSLISSIREENKRFAAYGIGLGASAITFYYIWWLALLFVGALILAVIIQNIGEIFSF